MSEENLYDFMHSNWYLFYEIAKESSMAMNEEVNSRRRPKANDEPGSLRKQGRNIGGASTHFAGLITPT